MLYPSSGQPVVILFVFLTGLTSGLFFDISKILTFLSGGDRTSRHIFDFLATIISFACLYFVNLVCNYGQFRLYVLVVFLISLIFEQFLSKVLWTKVFSKCYNRLREKWKTKRKINWKIYWFGWDLALSLLLL